MNYFSVDIETGGLDSNSDALLEIGIIYEDGSKNISDCPSFRGLFRPPSFSEDGSPAWNGSMSTYAYKMHKKNGLIDEILNSKEEEINKNGITREIRSDDPRTILMAASQFLNYYSGHRPLFFAGKNLATFDMPFLRNFYKNHNTEDLTSNDLALLHPHYCILDVGSMYYPYIRRKDWVPSLQDCLNYAGIKDEKVNHTSLDDCRATIAAIRHLDKVKEQSPSTT